MCEGRLVGEVSRKNATQENIMELATQFSDEAVA
jgi:ABC-type sugar transport system ATPase subunit